MAEDKESKPHIVRVIVGVMVFLALAIGIGVGALLWARTNSDNAEQTQDRTKTARIAACINDNVTTERSRLAIKASITGLVPEGTVLSDKQNAQLTKSATAVDEALPYRDCSPAGITEYYSHPPVDPAVP